LLLLQIGCNLYQLLPSTMIHSIFPIQFTCLTIFLHILSPSPFWSSSWPEALHLILHTFLHPISVLFSQHMPISSRPVLLTIKFTSSVFSLCLNSLLGTLSFTLTSHLWPFSSLLAEVPPCYLSWQARSPIPFTSILLRTQLLYSLPLLINDISLLVSNGTNCLNLSHPIWILASTDASASSSTLSVSPK